MDPEENSSASFILEHLLKIRSVIENGVKRQRWKLVMNSDSYTLIVKFPAKDDKAKGQGIQQSPLKKRASGVVASQHKNKEQGSSDVRLVAQPKQKKKKKKTPSRVARDRRRRREYWNRIKVARQLSAENLSAHYTKLQESMTVASPQSPVVSHLEDSECQLEHPPLNSETSSHRTRNQCSIGCE